LIGNKTVGRRWARLKKAATTTAHVAIATALFASVAHAQSPQPSALPTMIGENEMGGGAQTTSSGVSFLFYNPTQSSVPNISQQAPTTFGVTENMNVLSPGDSNANGLTLIGAALFADPSKAGKQQFQKQAIDQTLRYSQNHLNISLGYSNVGSLFNGDPSQSGPLSSDIEKDMMGKRGQNGLNAGFDYDQSGTKLGLQLASITDTLQNQHKLSETLSMERDFDKSLSLGYQRTETSTEQQQAAGTQSTNNVLHLAFSPTRSGFLLDAKSTQTLDQLGNASNDLSFKVAQHFSALNLTSQFESCNSNGNGAVSSWALQRYDAAGTVRPGLTFSGYWARKTATDGSGNDAFDAILQSAENRYVQLAAEYARTRAIQAGDTGKESLVARITPGSYGPLGPLLLTLSINNQQTPLLDNFTSYTASLEGQIVHRDGFDFGLDGVKYYLAYSAASAGGNYAVNGQQTKHSARTLRLVSAPSGKNGLSWTLGEQQRLDQNGQPLETASDVEAKYILSRQISVAVNRATQAIQPDGSISDQNQQGATINWRQTDAYCMILQYIHSRSPSQNISGEDGYFVTYSGPGFSVKAMNLGLGEQIKRDFYGQSAFGATGDVAYNWQADSDNLVNVTSKLTDWRNCGYNDQYGTSVEATGQLNFARLF
jgi:hypothetical protein